MELYKFLPKTNGKKCGKPTCMAFSLDLLQGKAKVDECPPLQGGHVSLLDFL